MFSQIPTSLLYWGIPLLLCPNQQNITAFSGYSTAGYSQFNISLQSHKGLGIGFEQHAFGPFRKISVQLSAKVKISPELTLSPGLSYLRNTHSNLNHSSIALQGAAFLENERSRAAFHLSFSPTYTQFSAVHLYQIDPQLNIGGAWSSNERLLFVAHFRHKNALFSYRQNPGFVQFSCAFKHKNIWLQIGLNSGTIASQPTLISQW